MKMSSTTKGTTEDTWADQATLYSHQAARLTELHGTDMVLLLGSDTLRHATTILDVGCGTGAFVHAYLQQYPQGIPGQTIISTDLSQGMLDKAQETIKPLPECQTKLVFQREDGTQLEGIATDSIDVVVSLFGVFLIPDRKATLNAIQRVLKPATGVFANASWMFGVSDSLASHGFGKSLQDVFALPDKILRPDSTSMDQILQWSTSDQVQSLLQPYTKGYLKTYQSLHNFVGEFDILWEMLGKNPMSAVNGASDEDAMRAKQALKEFLNIPNDDNDNANNTSHHNPLMLTTASILVVAHGFGGAAN